MPVVRGKAEQSNTSIFLGRTYALKVIRKLDSGLNPDVEIGIRLAEAGFAHVPRLAGALTYRSDGGDAAAVVMVQAYVPNQGNGWEEAQQVVAAFFERAAAEVAGGRQPPPLPAPGAGPSPAVRDLIPYLSSAELIGRRTAQLHVALAGRPDEAFVPEPITDAERTHLAAEMTTRGREALALLDEQRAALPAEATDLAHRVLAAGAAILRPFDALARTPVAVSRIRVHGDYHLGQVLRSGGDYVIVDFEGEPMRPLAERRRKQIALKDVAGLLRSIDYAIYGGLADLARAGRADAARLEPWAWMWQQWTSAAFLDGYRRAAGDAAFLPATEAGFTVALDAFLADRALYELVYELNSRPDWVTVPLWGLKHLSG
jgi:trehalose synthase-fused probable maltokinase